MCICICVCACVAPVGGFRVCHQAQHSCLLTQRLSWSHHPIPTPFCHQQPPSISLSEPLSTLSLSKPSVSHIPSSSSRLASEQIAGSLGNPCLGPCYLHHLIMVRLEPSQSRYLRTVCAVSLAHHS